MLTRLLDTVALSHVLIEQDLGEMSTLKANGMTFEVRSFKAEGLGHVSLMNGTGLFGLSKEETFIICPIEKDLPLYMYRRTKGKGADTLKIELYDTQVIESDLSKLHEVKNLYLDAPDFVPERKWFDSYKLAESVAKKGKEKHSDRFDSMTMEYIWAYMALQPADAEVQIKEKRNRVSSYVEGLLKNGGHYTHTFMKSLGVEKIQQLYRTALYGTEEWRNDMDVPEVAEDVQSVQSVQGVQYVS